MYNAGECHRSVYCEWHCSLTLREAREGGVSRDAEHEGARHGEDHADVGERAPTLLRRLNHRVVDEERVVVTHVR